MDLLCQVTLGQINPAHELSTGGTISRKRAQIDMLLVIGL